MRKHCPSGKIEYVSRPQARLQAEQIRKQTGLTLSPYGCPRCLFFHLTKKSGATTDSDLRRIAACIGAKIAAEEKVYLDRRRQEIMSELVAYWEQIVLDAFRESLDRRAQREILKAFGL